MSTLEDLLRLEHGLDARMTSTYVRRQDRWRLACYQQTPLPR